MATWYATREQCAAAFDVKASAWLWDTIDRLADVASRTVDREFHRHFYPLVETRTYGPPPLSLPVRDVGIWLEADLLSLTSLTVDGVTVTGAVAGPLFYGAPYSRLDFTDATSSGGETMAVTGTWGYSQDTAPAGALAAAISSTSATTCTVTNAASVGVGDQLLIDTERLVVTGRAAATTTATLTAGVDAQASTTTIPISSGTLVNVGETVTIDAERMRVLDITGNNLLVRRAVDGTALAAHLSAATVYAPRLLTVTRGDAGTTAATHLTAAVIARNVPPPLITELCIAEVQVMLGQEQAGWNLTIGEGEGTRESAGGQLHKLRKNAVALYRRGRHGRAI